MTRDDPRLGIIAGGDEGDTFVAFYERWGDQPQGHRETAER